MPLRDLRRLWGSRKQSSVPADTGGEEGGGGEAGGGGQLCALPLLQVWPSQDSPRGEADGQSFVFSAEETAGHQNDSGIESVQASPSPGVSCDRQPAPASPSPSATASTGRRSSTLLHPDHARLLLLRRPSTPEPQEEPQSPSTPSTASSMTSVAGAAVASLASHHSDPWDHRRRSSIARYSLLDALDLEYALLRAAARGSVGPYSLSESIHKLTFTQSLAFPALARGLAGKRRPSQTHPPPLDPSESGLNAFAKIVTALVLMLVSVMVFGVVYKYVRT